MGLGKNFKGHKVQEGWGNVTKKEKESYGRTSNWTALRDKNWGWKLRVWGGRGKPRAYVAMQQLKGWFHWGT